MYLLRGLRRSYKNHQAISPKRWFAVTLGGAAHWRLLQHNRNLRSIVPRVRFAYPGYCPCGSGVNREAGIAGTHRACVS